MESPQPTGKVVHYTGVPAQVFGDEAPGTTIRWLIDDDHDGAPVYALRLIEIAPGGHTPRHSHPYEHENFVVEGQGRVLVNGAWHTLRAGDVVVVANVHALGRSLEEETRTVAALRSRGIMVKVLDHSGRHLFDSGR